MQTWVHWESKAPGQVRSKPLVSRRPSSCTDLTYGNGGPGTGRTPGNRAPAWAQEPRLPVNQLWLQGPFSARPLTDALLAGRIPG